jgi:hypothetical protein
VRDALFGARVDTISGGLSVFFTQMITSVGENEDGKEFVSHAPGYWQQIASELWSDWKWQLKSRITSLAPLEEHLDLSDEERSGVLLSGDKLALAVTPHFFNLIPRDDQVSSIRGIT